MLRGVKNRSYTAKLGEGGEMMWAAHRGLVKALAAALLDSLPVQVLSPGKTGQRSWHLAEVPGEQATALDLGLVSKNVSPRQWDGHHDSGMVSTVLASTI